MKRDWNANVIDDDTLESIIDPTTDPLTSSTTSSSAGVIKENEIEI